MKGKGEFGQSEPKVGEKVGQKDAKITVAKEANKDNKLSRGKEDYKDDGKKECRGEEEEGVSGMGHRCGGLEHLVILMPHFIAMCKEMSNGKEAATVDELHSMQETIKDFMGKE